jgi:hypothetical protein
LLELVVAHPTGLVEVSEGSLQGTSIALASRSLSRTASAKEVTQVARSLAVEGDRLTYHLDMAAVGRPTVRHLHATLRRVSGVG